MLFGKVRLNQSISWLCFDVEDNFIFRPVSYVFKTTSYHLLLSKWTRTDGVIVSVPMIAVIGVVETSTPERQTSPPFVSSPIQLNQMRELSKKTVKFCQKKNFFIFRILNIWEVQRLTCTCFLSYRLILRYVSKLVNAWKFFLNLGCQRWLSNVSLSELPIQTPPSLASVAGFTRNCCK